MRCRDLTSLWSFASEIHELQFFGTQCGEITVLGFHSEFHAIFIQKLRHYLDYVDTMY